MTEQLPLDFPAYQRHSPTSKAAAEAIKPRIGPMHTAILTYLMGGGATDEQIQAGLVMAANTQRPRRRELQNMGLIVDSGTTRATASGRNAVVWKLATASPPHRGCSVTTEDGNG